MRNVGLRLLMLVIGGALLEGTLMLTRNVIVGIAFVSVPVSVPIIIALERFTLIEPAASIQLPFETRNSAVLRLGRQNDAVIMLGVLKIILGGDRVAG